MRKLSEAYGEHPAKHAVCVCCSEVFIDDSSLPGMLLCPNQCGACLRRVASLEEANRELHRHGKAEVAE